MSLKRYSNDYNKENGTLGIKIPTNVSISNNQSGVFDMSYTTEEQAISNYINLLLTRQGERFMQPDFGVGLYYYVFEQMTDILSIQLTDIINEQAQRWLPYIENETINVTNESDVAEIDNHYLRINIVFRVTNSGANRELTFFGAPGGVVQFNLT